MIKPKKGSTFRLYLPPAEGLSNVEIVETISVAPRADSDAKILVVEDNGKLRGVVAKQLRSLGFEVLEAENARSALRLLEGAEGVDLLFTDIVLPGKMDGFSLAREVTTHFPDTKILLTSGFLGASLLRSSELPAGIRLLSKPYRKEDLARTIHEVLTRACIPQPV